VAQTSDEHAVAVRDATCNMIVNTNGSILSGQATGKRIFREVIQSTLPAQRTVHNTPHQLSRAAVLYRWAAVAKNFKLSHSVGRLTSYMTLVFHCLLDVFSTLSTCSGYLLFWNGPLAGH